MKSSFFFWLGNVNGGEALRNLEMIRYLAKHNPIDVTIGVFEKQKLEFKQVVIPRRFRTDKLTGINNYLAEREFVKYCLEDFDAYFGRYGHSRGSLFWFFRISGDIRQTSPANIFGRVLYFFIKRKVIKNLALADAIITCSGDAGLLVESVNQRNIIKSRMFIDTDTFLPLKKNVRHKKFRILFVGRNDPIKNLVNLEKAVSGLNVDFTKVGVNTWVSKKQVAKEMQKADLLVMPSYYESYGATALEALACDCPVLLSNKVSAGNELAGNVYFCSTNWKSIRDSIRHIMQDPTRKTIVKYAGKRIRKEYKKNKVLAEECAEIMRYYHDKVTSARY